MLSPSSSFPNQSQIKFCSNKEKIDNSKEQFYNHFSDEDNFKRYFQKRINTSPSSEEKSLLEKYLYKPDEDKNINNNLLDNQFTESIKKNQNKSINEIGSGVNLTNPPKKNNLPLNSKKNKKKSRGKTYIEKKLNKYINQKSRRIKFIINYKKFSSYKYIIKTKTIGISNDYESIFKTEVNKLFEYYDYLINKNELKESEIYIYIINKNIKNNLFDALDSNKEDFDNIVNINDFSDILNFQNNLISPEDILLPEKCDIVINISNNKEKNNGKNDNKNNSLSSLKYFFYTS